MQGHWDRAGQRRHRHCPGRGLRCNVKDQPGITAEFELDESGAVVRLVAQPLGVFLPKA